MPYELAYKLSYASINTHSRVQGQKLSFDSPSWRAASYSRCFCGWIKQKERLPFVADKCYGAVNCFQGRHRYPSYITGLTKRKRAKLCGTNEQEKLPRLRASVLIAKFLIRADAR